MNKKKPGSVGFASILFTPRVKQETNGKKGFKFRLHIIQMTSYDFFHSSLNIKMRYEVDT